MLVREFLPRDAELGDELTDVPGSGGQGESAHTDTTVCGVPPLPHCAIGERWWGPHWQADSQQTGTTAVL